MGGGEGRWREWEGRGSNGMQSVFFVFYLIALAMKLARSVTLNSYNIHFNKMG
jgi:hypothetical protein